MDIHDMIIILLVLTVIQQQNKQSFWLSHTNIMSGERKVLGWLHTWIPACCIKVEELVHGQSYLWNTLPEGLVPRLQQCSMSQASCQVARYIAIKCAMDTSLLLCM